MFAWSFSARTLAEMHRLFRALGKNRYVKEVDHRMHWMVDTALESVSEFYAQAQVFKRRCNELSDLDPSSRDPRLWRSSTLDEVMHALTLFTGPDGELYQERLVQLMDEVKLPLPDHLAFESEPDDPPHPEFILLDWIYLPVDELDTEMHQGALSAMENSGEEIHASAPIYVEGPTISVPELCAGFENGELLDELLIWSDGPYSYSDYVFRGAARAAKLTELPQGFRDF